MTTTEAFGPLRKGVFPNLQRHALADEYTRPFWDAAREDRLVVPRCSQCGTFRLPPLPICHICQSDQFDWAELSGEATVYSYTVVRHPLHPDLSQVCPYVSGAVELDGTKGEGARLLVNIVDCEPEEIGIGSRVRIVFDHENDDLPTPRAVPIRHEES
jgi:uncharacterized OB-fold protein